HTIAEEAKERRSEQSWHRRQTSAERQAHCRVDASGDETFEHRRLHGISCRDLLREVVVDRPTERRRDNEKWTGNLPEVRLSFPGQNDATGDDSGHTERDSPFEVLTAD